MSGTVSTVARNRTPMPRWLRILIGLGLIGLASSFLVWMFWGWIAWWIWGQSQEANLNAAPVRDFTMGQPLEQKPARREAPPPPPDAKQPPPTTTAAPPPPPQDTKPAAMRPMAVWQAQSSAPSLGLPGKAPSPTDSNDDDIGGTGSAKDSAYAKDLQATRVNDSRPKFHSFNNRFTIRKGTTIGCTPPMPIDTGISGPLSCDVDENIYGIDGTFIVVPKHSTINGQIEHGLGLGQDRAVIVFTDILTAGPDFLPIPLGAATAASDLGQNGVPVDVNAHEWDKIKHVLLFAGIEGLSTAVQASLQSGGGNQYFGSFGSTGQSLASIAAQHDLNIPTTGYRGPGYSIKVYVNNYVDLSNFYSVTLRRGR